MITLRSPTSSVIERFLREQAPQPFTYEPVGCTRANAPRGFVVDRTHVRLGQGVAVFHSACQALREWRHFDLGWVTAGPSETPIAVGQCIAVWASMLGLTWVNACRIVYIVDEEGPVQRFGFAYGTLPGHVEMGEERFLVEWNKATDEVSYEIVAHSRPRHWAVRLGYPLMRLSQKRFGRGSAAAMQRAVRSS
ncbi:MAG TPA: DUF1990 domain-containing protein [Caulifigura sp.]|nr:DUF1990 domain-containing protein [Caulifigura sp.]